MFFKFPKLIERYDEKNKSTLKDLQIFEWSSAAIFNEMRFYKYFPGRIIFLLGTSSAGKSSIAKYIKDNSITDPNLIKFTGTDVIYYDLFIDCFYKNLPKETEFLFNKIRDVSKIVGYINEPEKFTLDNLEYLHLRSNVYIRIKTILEKFHDMRDELSSSVEMKYQYYCAKAIIMPLLQGKTVIIDTIELGSYFQALGHHLIKCKTDTIIVYCSPQNLEKHIVDRNKINIYSYDEKSKKYVLE